MTKIPTHITSFNPYAKHRNEEEDAIMSFLSEGGKVAKLLDSETAKKKEAKVKREELKGGVFIFSKQERLVGD